MRFNLRRMVFYLIIICLASFSLGIGITFATGGNLFWNKGETYTVQEQKSTPVSDVKEISVDVSSTKVNIIAENREDIKAELTGSVVTTADYSKPELTLSQSGSTVNIKVGRKAVIGFVWYFTSNLQLNIYIPAGYNNSLIVDSSSGGMNISNLKLSELKCSVNSGSVKLKDISADTFSYNGSSGGLNAENLYTTSSSIRSSSGSIRLSGFKGRLNSSSSSGGAYVDYAELNSDVEIHASSGGIELRLPENSEFNLNARTSSGGINCDFPLTVSGKVSQHSLEGTVGSGKNKINLECSSGSVNIKK